MISTLKTKHLHWYRQMNEWILFYVAFCTIMAISRQKEAGTMTYSYFEWLQGFFIVHSTIGSAVHSMPLNSLEHCICTQPRWQISAPTEIQTWYPQVTSPSRYEWAIGAGLLSVYYVEVRTIVLSRHGSNLARSVIIHDIIHGLIYVPSTPNCGFFGSRRMETAPTSVEVLLRPT